MITEYVYENQEYENVLVKIKAALMDIISSEENKLYEIEQKITTTTDEDFKEKLNKLCADERSALRQIIITMNTLSSYLEKVDSYSKDLDSIEDENIKELIDDLKNRNIGNEKQLTETPRIVTMEEETQNVEVPSHQQEEVIETVNQDPGVLQEINEYEKENESPEVEETTIAESPEVEQEQTIENSEQAPEIVSESTTDDEQAIEGQEELVEQEPLQEEMVENDNQGQEISPEESSKDQSIEENNQVEEQPELEQEETIENVDSSEEMQEEINQEDIAQESTQESQKTDSEESGLIPIEIPEEINVQEETQEPTEEMNTSPIVQEQQDISQPENTPVIPITPEQTEMQSPSEEIQEEQVSPEITEEGVVAPPNFDDDNQQQEDFTPSIPAIETQKEVTYQEDLPREPLMTFIKTSQDTPKAILTSLKQVTNLRASYQTQNALLSSRGTIASRNINGVDNDVQELVDNGLLAPSPENIEKMMEEANRLYNDGKINEAQEMYEKISALNKQLQENNSVVK